MIVLDSHALVWLAFAQERLGDEAAAAIAAEDLAISVVSVQEIAYLVVRGWLELDRPVGTWFVDVLRSHEIETLAPDTATALRAGSLNPDTFPGDPADRLIYATAVERGARLVSADRRLRAADPARVIW